MNGSKSISDESQGTHPYNTSFCWPPTAAASSAIREEQLMYSDLRSREKALNRQRKQSQKYYGYRGVKPSWIGQKYYTLVLGPNEDTETYTKPKYNRNTRVSRNKNVLDQQFQQANDIDKTLINENTSTDLIHELGHWLWSFFYHENSVHLCVSEARANNSLTHAPTTLANIESTLRTNPQYTSFTKHPLPPNKTITLALKTWTKTDSYTIKDTDIQPLDRRHHHGKKYREKSSMRSNIKHLGRNAKTVGAQQYEIEEIRNLTHEWWYDMDPWCCEWCLFRIDVDDNMDGEFQDPEEYGKAREALIEEMKVQRMEEERDEVWLLMFADRAEMGAVTTANAALEGVGVVVEDGAEAVLTGVPLVDSEYGEPEEDWSDIIVVTLEQFGDADARSQLSGDFDVLSHADLFSNDGDWDVLNDMDAVGAYSMAP